MRGWSSASMTSRSSPSYEIGDRTSPFGSGGMRSQGCGRGDGDAGGDGNRGVRRNARGQPGARGGRRGWGRCSRRGEGEVPSFKLWLRYAKPSKGTVRMDDGAARVLREQGSSLLPVGWSRWRATSWRGTRSRSWRRAGSSARGSSITPLGSWPDQGHEVAAVRELMPHAADEAVHRDIRFVPGLSFGGTLRGAHGDY